MILWKNMIIIGSALLLFHWLLSRTLREPEERRWLKTLLGCCLVMMVTIFTWNPYLVTMAVLVGTIMFAISKGVPPIAAVFVLTVVVPLMRYRVGGLGSVNALIDLSTLSFAGIAVILARLSIPSAFRRNSAAKPTDILLILFIVLYAVLSSRGFSFALVIKSFVDQMLTIGAAYYVGSRGRIKSVRFLAASMVFISAAVSLALIIESLRHWPLFFGAYSLKGLDLESDRTLNIRYGLMRATGPFEDAIAASMFLAMAFLACWGAGLLRTAKSLLVGPALAILIALWFTFSRTGIVGLAAGIVVISLLRRKGKELAIACGVGAVAMILTNRITEGGASGTSDYRVLILHRTMEVLRPNLLFGDNNIIRDGKLNDMVQGQGIVDMVNTYLSFLMQGGIVLLSFFALFVIAPLFLAWQNAQKNGEASKAALQITIGQLVVYLVSFAFTSPTDKNLYYVFLLSGLVTGLATFYREKAVKGQPTGAVTLPPVRQRLTVG